MALKKVFLELDGWVDGEQVVCRNDICGARFLVNERFVVFDVCGESKLCPHSSHLAELCRDGGKLSLNRFIC